MKNGEKPAMPIRNDLCPDEKPHWVDGMTKREYFAGKAMQAYISGHLSWTDGADGGSAMADPEETAKESVKYADAILAELDK